METLEEGDKVLFAGQILTLKQYDTWFNKWDFVEKSISPVEYQNFDPPIKIKLTV